MRAAALAAALGLPLLATAGCANASPMPSTTVSIDGTTRYQRITGFGASEAFGQAETVMNAPAAVQQQVPRLLYSPTNGAGLTILRNEISADAGTTIDPTAPSSPSAAPTYLPLTAVAQDHHAQRER